MNRGSYATPAPSGRRWLQRFNEAPIHESGKSSRPGIGWSGTSRFNEAPIHESGKFYQDVLRVARCPALQ